MSDRSSSEGSELLNDPQQRREAIAQALLHILTEDHSTSNPTSPPSSLYLSAQHCEMLADFIQTCNQETIMLQRRVAALEELHPSHQE